ncbi:hydrolase [Seonamhaeicola sp. ML3]|uniref:hydrolase n=1 Tax=Seonamhaeicola sp. ML3 TaxID=2937786 RepID=UPI00200BE5A1|nr:hydrolase [Seonamhaeicola sp. ML3]
MKQKIFMYLFVFAVLLVLFQYVNSKRIFEDLNTKIEKRDNRIKKHEDSLEVLNNAVLDASHFNLERNEDALSYFENDGHVISELIPFVKDKLYETNESKGEHPIVPYSSSEGRKMMINTVKLLNHKWIIADFSDGEYWGEIFLTYEITKDMQVHFNLVESFLYPFD